MDYYKFYLLTLYSVRFEPIHKILRSYIQNFMDWFKSDTNVNVCNISIDVINGIKLIYFIYQGDWYEVVVYKKHHLFT